ncbi:hypothetical protein OK016_07365 [Vibrio chagasii]|nr:hypothetical protein [Vibrio chagasii]
MLLSDIELLDMILIATDNKNTSVESLGCRNLFSTCYSWWCWHHLAREQMSDELKASITEAFGKSVLAGYQVLQLVVMLWMR